MANPIQKTCRACLLESGAIVMFTLKDPELRQSYFECTTIEVGLELIFARDKQNKTNAI